MRAWMKTQFLEQVLQAGFANRVIFEHSCGCPDVLVRKIQPKPLACSITGVIRTRIRNSSRLLKQPEEQTR